MSSNMPAHLEDQIRSDYLRGITLAQICKSYQLPRFQVTALLAHPSIEPHLRQRISQLTFRHVNFKMQAFEYAEEAIEKLKEVLDTAIDPDLIRKAAKDLVELAGLNPSKVVRLSAGGQIELGEETKEWLANVMLEASASAKQGAIIEPEL